MTNIIIILSSIVTLASAVPYIIEIVRGKTKPRVVSWFTWTLITAIAAAASYVDGKYPAAILSLCAVIETLSIVILGLKYGDRKFDRLDIVCQVGALVGLGLWLLLKSPAIAVLAMIAIDLIGCVPTIAHAWKRPNEETWLTFLLAGIGGGLTLAVVGAWTVTSMGYPLYILVINIIITLIIVGRMKYVLAGETKVQ
jgi:hypothetical protein